MTLPMLKRCRSANVPASLLLLVVVLSLRVVLLLRVLLLVLLRVVLLVIVTLPFDDSISPFLSALLAHTLALLLVPTQPVPRPWRPLRSARKSPTRPNSSSPARWSSGGILFKGHPLAMTTMITMTT